MTTRGKATGKSERLAVLNNAEQEALYGLPDFEALLQIVGGDKLIIPFC